MYAGGNTDDGIILLNSTQVINNHIWWSKREVGPIPSPVPRYWRRPRGLGGLDIHDNTTSKFIRSWGKFDELYHNVPPTPGGPIIC